MTIKDFFKPNVWKIIITILIFILLLAPITIFDRCIGRRVCPQGEVNYYSPFTCTVNCIPNSQALSLNLIQRGPIYLIAIIISYLISCLIIKPNKQIRKNLK